jgi:hypothetical protein
MASKHEQTRNAARKTVRKFVWSVGTYDGEYTGTINILARNVESLGNKTVKADGVVIECSSVSHITDIVKTRRTKISA